MRMYHKSKESGDDPAWICGHWNGSPLEIGMGSAELEVEGKQVPLHAGTVVMIEPGERLHVTSVGTEGARWVVIKERSEPNTKYVS